MSSPVFPGVCAMMSGVSHSTVIIRPPSPSTWSWLCGILKGVYSIGTAINRDSASTTLVRCILSIFLSIKCIFWGTGKDVKRYKIGKKKKKVMF